MSKKRRYNSVAEVVEDFAETEKAIMDVFHVSPEKARGAAAESVGKASGVDLAPLLEMLKKAEA